MSKRILVIDDDALVRRMLRRLLERAGTRWQMPLMARKACSSITSNRLTWSSPTSLCRKKMAWKSSRSSHRIFKGQDHRHLWRRSDGKTRYPTSGPNPWCPSRLSKTSCFTGTVECCERIAGVDREPLEAFARSLCGCAGCPDAGDASYSGHCGRKPYCAQYGNGRVGRPGDPGLWRPSAVEKRKVKVITKAKPRQTRVIQFSGVRLVIP